MGDAGHSNYATTKADTSKPLGTQANPQPVTTEFINGKGRDEVSQPQICLLPCLPSQAHDAHNLDWEARSKPTLPHVSFLCYPHSGVLVP